MNFMNKKLQFYIWVFFLFLYMYHRNQFYNIYTSAMHSMLITIKLFTYVHVIGKNRDQHISYYLYKFEFNINFTSFDV